MTDTEMAILTALTVRIPFFTAEQAARTWWDPSPEGEGKARATLERLVRGRFLWQAMIEAHPEVHLDRPLGVWESGNEVPQFSAIVRHARRRFSTRDVPMRVYLATRAAAHAFGGEPGKLKPASTTHDLHLAGVYLRLVRTNPDRADRWISEAELASQRIDQVLPDAAIVRDDGSLELVVEFVGSSYKEQRLLNIHLDCEARNVPYELW